MARVGLDAIHGVVLLDPVVDETQPTHRVAAFVRQQMVGDPMRGGEVLQDLDGVVADCEQSHAVHGQRGGDLLQLNELRLAERSPLRTAIEHHQGRPPGALRV